ncbi:MAG TPA: pilus assembly protein N-terminal domain-containing protein [bacterium]|nr:pilus assembly protein N-terminal domain-containing protein [bacterium]
MHRAHLAFLAGLVTVSGLGVPLPIEAGTAIRVVVLSELTVRAEEVGISSKHLTLIHFEMGDVSMVAVGDPTIVSVTVKGPDVLLKATASSGTTNAFIWQAGRYTQWLLEVRQDNKDARLIVVRDASPAGREQSLRASDRPDPGSSAMEAQTGGPPTDQSSATDPGGRHPGERRLVSSPPAPDKSDRPPPVANSADESVLSQVTMTIAPRVIDGQIFFYYTLENYGPVTLLTDILRLRILDRDGHRLAFGINRASPPGRLGRLQTNDVEYGMIAIGSSESGLVLEWKLGTLGSAAQHRLRLELPARSVITP